MPIIETDLLYAYLSKEDRHHEVASKIFDKIRGSDIKPTPEISALSLIEVEILLKSGILKVRKRKPTDQEIADYFKEICKALEIYAIPLNPVTCESMSLSASIRAKYRLGYYDSHYAAQAQLHDKQIISTDKMYDRVVEVKRIDPQTY